MKLRLASILLIAAALCAIGAQAWAMSASWVWETQVFTGTPAYKSIAVDPTGNAVYAGVNGNQIVKLDGTTGAIIGTYGPVIYKAGGTVIGSTISAGQPAGMAVDPVTHYLYANNGGTAIVIDMSAATSDPKSAIWQRTQANLRTFQLSFSPDGQSLASVNGTTNVVLVLHRKADNTFDTTNYKVNYTPSGGILTPNNISDPRGCALDGSGHVYQADNYAAHPINRFNLIPGVSGSVSFVTKQEMAFRAVHTSLNTIDTDGYGNLWVGDVCNSTYPSYHKVRCFHDGLEVGSFDLWDGHNPYSAPYTPSNGAMGGQILCCSKSTSGNVRVYVVGQNDPIGGASNGQYVACYEITGADTLVPGGTISGTVHNSTGPPTTPIAIGLQPTYVDDANSGWDSVPLIGYSPATADGTFANVTVPPGTWSVIGQKDEVLASRTLLPTRKTHYEVASGANTDVGDFVVLPKAGSYVEATLGEHNVEQGLYVLSSRNSTFSKNQAATIGGRDCRTLGYDSTSLQMAVDVDNSFWPALPNPTLQPFWLECDLYDTGYDRMSVLANTRPLGPTGGDSACTSMAWQPKTDTKEWTTWKWYRPDGCFAGWYGYEDANGVVYYPGGDFVFNPIYYDGNAPRGTKHISRIAVRTAALPADASYMPMDTIAKAKQFILGQRLTNDIQVKYLGGVAVKLANKTVVANGIYKDRQYVVIEDTDRTSAIRVMTTDTMTVPLKIDVVGALMPDPDTQELVIQPVTITKHDQPTDPPVDPIKPIEWASMRGVCGADLNYVIDTGSETFLDRVQYGVSGGVGVNTVGLTVRLCGKVTATGLEIDNTPYAYVDDGSSPRGEGVTGEADQKGVRVVLDTMFPVVLVNDFVTVTGHCLLGLYDPTPADPNNNDEWRYTVVYATAVAKL